MADSSQAEMRIWARANGFAVSDRGRMPRAVTQAFLAAQAAGSADAAPSGGRRAPVVRVPARSDSAPGKSAKLVGEARAGSTSRPRGSRSTSVRAGGTSAATGSPPAAAEEGPESTVPESTVPESTVPESTVPESTVPESTVPESTGGEKPVERAVVTKRAAAGSGRRRGSAATRSEERGKDPVQADELAVEATSGAVAEPPPVAASGQELAELRARLAALETKLADLTVLVSGTGRPAGRQALLRRLRR